MSKDNIDISVTDDRITIRGEKKEQEEKNAFKRYARKDLSGRILKTRI